MTTKANKYGLRAAAAERSNRHAQRTPLPPRPGVVEAAREPMAINRTDLACACPKEGHKPMCVKSVESHGEATDAKSLGKAQAFADLAASLEWDASVAAVGETVEVTATRGPETIVQAWRNGVWDYSISFYAFGDRTTKPRNAAGAAKLLGRTPDEAETEAGKVASNRHFRKAEPKDLSVRLEDAKKSLPFDPELSPDELVAGILAGQAVQWYNRISRGTETAMVGRSGVRFTFLRDGSRIANFCCPGTGYRSCLVTAILKVGRGSRTTTKGSEFETVEVG